MKKKTIIYIACAVAVVLIAALVIYFVVAKSENSNSKMVITKYDENFEIEKEIQITNKKQIKEINKICENPSLEQDEKSPYLAIRNDVKLDLGNGKFFMIQLNKKDYCYYENADTKLVIKMPEGLLKTVNDILQ